MEDLFAQISNIENWLRDKPHAGQTERLEMINRLRALNDRLNKLQEGLQLLNKGESPLKVQQNDIRNKERSK